MSDETESSTSEKNGGQVVRLKNGDLVSLRMALALHGLLVDTLVYDMEGYRLLMDAVSGQSISDKQRENEWRDSGIIRPDGSLMPIIRSLLESCSVVSDGSSVSLTNPCAYQKDVLLWESENEEKRLRTLEKFRRQNTDFNALRQR